MQNTLVHTEQAVDGSRHPVSPSWPMPVTLTPAATTQSSSTLTEATKTVASSGTPEALGAGTFKEVLIYPLRTNTGDAFFGTVSTNDTQHGTLPVSLSAVHGKLIDISQIFIDVAVNGEGVRYIGIS